MVHSHYWPWHQHQVGSSPAADCCCQQHRNEVEFAHQIDGNQIDYQPYTQWFATAVSLSNIYQTIIIMLIRNLSFI